MLKRIWGAFFVLMLALSFSTFTFAQDAATQEVKKDEVKKVEKKAETATEMKAAAPLKSVSCDPTCGFMCQSHDEKELLSIVKTHAKSMHKMEMTDAKIKELMKTAGEAKKTDSETKK